MFIYVVIFVGVAISFVYGGFKASQGGVEGSDVLITFLPFSLQPFRWDKVSLHYNRFDLKSICCFPPTQLLNIYTDIEAVLDIHLLASMNMTIYAIVQLHLKLTGVVFAFIMIAKPSYDIRR